MIYLDNAATSFPKAPGVVEAMVDFLENVGANAGRASYGQAREASRIIYDTRKLLAELLGVLHEERICFTLNATQALNLAIKGLVKPGMTVLTSPLEHNSVMRPLRCLEEQNVKIRQFAFKELSVDWDDWSAKLDENPDLVIFTAASNVNGLVLPYRELAQNARQKGIPVILDAAQALGTLPINGDDYDIICFPGHKGLLGPMGTGGLYISPGIEIASLFQGGTGSRSSEELQPEVMPDKLESGTLNIPGIAGLNSALKFILHTGINKIRKHKQEITANLIYKLTEIPELILHSPLSVQQNAGVISLTSRRLGLSEFALHLDRAGIATRMGLHCAPSAHKTLDTFSDGGTIRLSPGYFTTREEIDQAVAVIKGLHE